MDDNERLTPHEAASVLHDQLKTLMRETGMPAEKAVKVFNEAARRAGLAVRVTIESELPRQDVF